MKQRSGRHPSSTLSDSNCIHSEQSTGDLCSMTQ